MLFLFRYFWNNCHEADLNKNDIHPHTGLHGTGYIGLQVLPVCPLSLGSPAYTGSSLI